MCGFIGIQRQSGTVFAEIVDALIAIQHRGQDATGIVTFDDRFHLKCRAGLVRENFRQEDVEVLKGSVGLGHVRYPTVGSGGAENAQPFVVNHPYGIALAHNGNLTNCDELTQTLERVDRRLINSSCDAEVILNVLASELDGGNREAFSKEALFGAIERTIKRLKGAYSVVGMVAGHGMFAFRDPFGIKPILMGRRAESKGPAWCIASESVVLEQLEYQDLSNIEAGEAVFIDQDGALERRQLTHEQHHPCLFEYVYFARPDSFLDKVSVYKTRLRLGEKLAETWKATGLDVDVVIPIPESATTAAVAMARALDVKYREGFVKNRYIGRTFIMPNDEARRSSIRAKLKPIPIEFENKRVLLVDDSIVRGHTSRKIVEMARNAGARKVYFASYSPPLRHPCVYGIDMSTKSEFIAKGRNEEQIAQQIGADKVIYQTLDGLEAATREGNPELKSFCNACFSGKYPTGDVTTEMLSSIEGERANARNATAATTQATVC